MNLEELGRRLKFALSDNETSVWFSHLENTERRICTVNGYGGSGNDELEALNAALRQVPSGPTSGSKRKDPYRPLERNDRT